MSQIAAIHEALAAAGLPVSTVRLEGGIVTAEYGRALTAEEATAAASLLDPIRWRRSALIDRIGHAARQRILTLAPEWKQLNMLARATELQDKRQAGNAISQAEEDEAARMRQAWGVIKNIRASSNQLEAAAAAAVTHEELDAVEAMLG